MRLVFLDFGERGAKEIKKEVCEKIFILKMGGQNLDKKRLLDLD